MKTLTISIPDDVAANLAESIKGGTATVEEAAARVVTEAFAPNWLDEFDAEDRAAIEEGFAQLERGEGVRHEQVFEELRQKHGW